MMARKEPGARPKKAAASKKGAGKAGGGGELTVKRGGPPVKGAGERAGVPPISNYRPPTTKDSDLFVKYAKLAEAQDKVIDRALKTVQSEKQALGQIYRQAKEDGVPAERIRVLKGTIKERKRDAAEILVEERERAFQHTALKSKLSEVLPMSYLLQPPTLVEVEFQGEHAGKNGEPPDNNPYTPGTPQFAHWHSGHKKGARESSAKVFSDDKGKGVGDGKGGDAPAGDGPTRLTH